MTWLTVVLLAATLMAAAGIMYQWVGAARNRRKFAGSGTFIDVGGRRLHYRCAGTSMPAVVFEAGIAASSVSWSTVQPEVATFSRTCSYDRAGLAWSDAGERVRSAAGFVAELRRLLERAGIPPPYVLVGHSFGGIIIRAFARAHPSEIAGLVFVDTLHPREWSDPTLDQRRMLRGGVFLSNVGAVLARLGVVRLCLALLSGGAPGVPRRFSRVFGPTAAALLEHMVGEVQKLPSEVLPMVQAYWSGPRAFQGMAQHLSALPFCCEELARSEDSFGDLPVVVLSAANRAPRWLAADAALAGMSTAGQHRVALRAGHWIQLDDPALVIQAVRDVVGRVRERSVPANREM
jgi:pimeloyl-ACP methyl ester carboxylesterase